MRIARIARLLLVSAIGFAVLPANANPIRESAPANAVQAEQVEPFEGPVATYEVPSKPAEPAPASAEPEFAAPGYAVPQAVPAATAVARPLKVMPLGDSITYGVGSSIHVGYRLDLWKRLYTVGFAPNFIGSLRSGHMGDNNHEGHIGWRIDQVSANVTRFMALYQPDVVLLHIGTNDLAQNYDMAHAPQRLSLLIDKIRRARPTARIYVASLIAMKSSQAGVSTKRTAFNNAIPGIVQKKGPMVRFVPQHLVPAKDLSDQAHPNNCGYAKMAYIWYYALGRSSLNQSGKAWPTGYYPFGSAKGPCNP
ncbi:GDSL-type esterase/lipase family protein [Kribbella sp. NBC_01245]|uniref:SGNH/GDSL hydrolase family protein n=1 Tax=Kribbella sp. NBC_01245 TaxID=2903578 RepID=UPI002E289F9F|nr:GDSL-type esterase/lipase family protein [Kribbella sp. NBC_01245]